MGWLVSLLATPALEFIWSHIVMGAADLIMGGVDALLEHNKRAGIVDGNDKQAKIIEALAARIAALEATGQMVPDELRKEMIRESAKLPLFKPINY